MRASSFFISQIILLLLPSVSLASGLIHVEGQPGRQPIEIEHIEIKAEVRGLSATVSVKEVFVNTTNGDLEGTFLFPVPDGGAFGSFSMSMGNEMITGNLIDSEKAAKIYRE
ncbi:MAG: VIT domain-containing protein, partial [Planctomycetota bacterium]